MTVATLRLDLSLSHCHSNRDRRRQMRAIMEKLHQHFNVSVADSEETETVDAILVVAAVARTRRDVRELLAHVADAVAAHPRVEVLGHAITEV
ncbi:MAG: hypothetical protein NVSMB9_34020 [Isosphaeraceae bacterium]